MTLFTNLHTLPGRLRWGDSDYSSQKFLPPPSDGPWKPQIAMGPWVTRRDAVRKQVKLIELPEIWKNTPFELVNEFNHSPMTDKIESTRSNAGESEVGTGKQISHIKWEHHIRRGSIESQSVNSTEVRIQNFGLKSMFVLNHIKSKSRMRAAEFWNWRTDSGFGFCVEFYLPPAW